jgi:hypothetical protein
LILPLPRLARNRPSRKTCNETCNGFFNNRVIPSISRQFDIASRAVQMADWLAPLDLAFSRNAHGGWLGRGRCNPVESRSEPQSREPQRSEPPPRKPQREQRALGRPNPNAVQLFSAVELMALLADREWLDEAKKTIGQYWKRQNARRNGVMLEN